MVNLNSAENAHFMLWPDQFQKIRQIKAWYYRIDLTNPLRSYNAIVWLRRVPIVPKGFRRPCNDAALAHTSEGK